mgnify:CR=1 FL=1
MPRSGTQHPVSNSNAALAQNNRPRRFRMGIGTALMLGFGLLVFTAASSVLGIGLWSARENTIELLRDREEFLVDLLEQRVRGHFDPVMTANEDLAQRIGQGLVDSTKQQELVNFIARRHGRHTAGGRHGLYLT